MFEFEQGHVLAAVEWKDRNVFGCSSPVNVAIPKKGFRSEMGSCLGEGRFSSPLTSKTMTVGFPEMSS